MRALILHGGFLLGRTAAAWADSSPVQTPSSVAPTLPPDANATAMTDIHDIKPVLDVGPDLHWLIWAAAALVLIALAVLAWRLWRRRKTKPQTVPAAPPVAPPVEALARLDALAAEQGLSLKLFYFKLSAVLRHYMERRFDFPAEEMTTEELLPKVDRLSLAPDLVPTLKTFCRRADPIKFAGATADRERMVEDLAFVRLFVIKTSAVENSMDGLQQAPTDTLAITQ